MEPIVRGLRAEVSQQMLVEPPQGVNMVKPQLSLRVRAPNTQTVRQNAVLKPSQLPQEMRLMVPQGHSVVGQRPLVPRLLVSQVPSVRTVPQDQGLQDAGLLAIPYSPENMVPLSIMVTPQVYNSFFMSQLQGRFPSPSEFLQHLLLQHVLLQQQMENLMPG